MKSATILIADDEPQIRRVMKATLSAQGYAIVEARDGQDAVLKFRSERPDLVILDMNMPGMGGLEACREIRNGSNVPIIILTVRNAEKDKVNALDAGADTRGATSLAQRTGRDCGLVKGIRAGLRKARHRRARQTGPPHAEGVRIAAPTHP
jgi:CheY-like chemotaxis protein